MKKFLKRVVLVLVVVFGLIQLVCDLASRMALSMYARRRSTVMGQAPTSVW